ncbi:MAG: adenosylcobinamide amidohydrolase [Rhodobacteraceae bacterium]|nr:adenosylcobinamide amidohydrolase [Paracoccaceae bacterium]
MSEQLRLTRDGPWLIADLGAPHRVLSWATHRPGLCTARRVAWREVRDADLTPDLDVPTWLAAALQARGAADAVTMLTSRSLDAATRHTAHVGTAQATCLATVGLSNAERVGARRSDPMTGWGTINLLVRLTPGLTDPALIEAASIATQARTTAVIEAGLDLSTGRATGTGTDCIAIASPPGQNAYCGLHTEIGEAVGRAVHGAVSQGVADWLAGPGRAAPRLSAI